MAKKLTPSKQPSILSPGLNWVRSHTVISSIAVCVLLLIGIWAGYAYNQYQQKLSKEDFMNLASTAQTVFGEVGGQKIESHENCSYQRPGEFASVRLYCTVQLATFVPYISDSSAIMLARAFEEAIVRRYENTLGTAEAFIQKPDAGYSDITVVLNRGSPRHQCHFQIGSGVRAQNLAPFLPRKTETNLIGLYFECAAESRGEYFPVTYRQG